LVSAASDTTITGWANAVHTVYSEIRGYFLFLFFVNFSFCAHVSYILFPGRSLLPQLKELGLLEAFACKLGASESCELSCAFSVIFFFFCLCLLTFAFVGPPHGGGSRGAQNP
jgi:hypothetical protein